MVEKLSSKYCACVCICEETKRLNKMITYVWFCEQTVAFQFILKYSQKIIFIFQSTGKRKINETFEALTMARKMSMQSKNAKVFFKTIIALHYYS